MNIVILDVNADDLISNIISQIGLIQWIYGIFAKFTEKAIIHWMMVTLTLWLSMFLVFIGAYYILELVLHKPAISKFQLQLIPPIILN